MASDTETKLIWRKVLDPGELAEGRVKPVTCGHTTLCMTRHQGSYGALDNRCPHQGGPLGEGSIGFAYPAAMGAWAATREEDPRFHGLPVVAVSGDGGFGQYLGELTTAVKYGMKITHVLVNNSELGKISKEQRSGNWDVWQTSLHNPDFSKYAELCGALGIRVTRAGELDAAMERAFAHDGPSMVEVVADPELV